MELVLGEESAEIVAARAEALKDELRPLDRCGISLFISALIFPPTTLPFFANFCSLLDSSSDAPA